MDVYEVELNYTDPDGKKQHEIIPVYDSVSSEAAKAAVLKSEAKEIGNPPDLVVSVRPVSNLSEKKRDPSAA